jgi:hypothetical protein
VDLSEYTLSDGYRVRFTFPAETYLEPGQALVVFGGGDVSTYVLRGTAGVFTAGGGLGLNNTGDVITLADREGNAVDTMIYGSEGGLDRSLTRATDGDPEASFIPHANGMFSPGLRQDGEPF